MNCVVPRTCTELSEDASGIGSPGLLFGESPSLSDCRSTPAYVLLGDPGSGKTTAFELECDELGNEAKYLTARQFLTPNLLDDSELQHKTLYIDGLDERRAGAANRLAPLDAIISRLARLGRPRFRISCREADWLGHVDRQAVSDVSPDTRITVLRLDELDERRIIELLRHEHNRTDAQEFITEARQRGVGGLLVNPLTLRLLVHAVRHGGDWPDSRLKTLEMACRQIATEHNQEHRIATSPPPLEAAIDATGYLCALQLLADFEGYVSPPGIAVPSCTAITELGALPAQLPCDDLEHALITKLFTAVGDGLVPLHRQVAEFLAGRYLAKLIRDGVPARRVAALMTSPSDDRVVTSLRGLSAWLAAHSREARPLLIAADPVGVGLYGDIGDLTIDEKKRLMESLATFAGEAPLLGHQRRDGRSYGYRDDTAWAFRCLATADMVPTMRDLLGDMGAGAADERLAMLVLEALASADDPHAVAELEADLAAVLWSESQPAPIRRRSLSAYLNIVPSSDRRTRDLQVLLDAVQDGSVPDPDDDSRGALLEVLYPEEVTPSEVWRYALPRNAPELIGRFRVFWDRTLLDKSSDQHLIELLDSLQEDAARLAVFLEQPDLGELPQKLLARCLEANGDQQNAERLYGWLAAAGDSLRHHHRQEEPAHRVRAWLEARPQVQKQVVLAWLRQRDPDDSDWPVGYWYCDALHSSTLPPDFGLWCLEQAIRIGDAEPEVSQGLLWQAYRSIDKPSTGAGLTLEVMRDRTSDHPALAQHLDEFCMRRAASSSPAESKYQRQIRKRREKWDEEHRQRREDWANHLREHEEELWENRFSPQNLATLSNVYLGLVAGADRQASPRDRISEFIGGDQRLVDAVMAALRFAALREDVPEVGQTISLLLDSKHSWLAFPVLASLDLLDKEDPARLDSLQDTQRRRALATYYCVPRGTETPHWHHRWLQQNPEMVLDVLHQCAVADVRAGNEIPSGLNELDDATGLGDLAHEIRLRLLAAFPTRSSNKQLRLLDRLSIGALDHSDQTALLALSRRKQGLKSMPVAQRVRWWATEALITQGTRVHQLEADLGESEVRTKHLAQFLVRVWDRHDRRRSILADIRDPPALAGLIEILGRWCAVADFASGAVTLEMEVSDLIRGLIGQLGSESGEEAQRALEDLVENSRLKGWHPSLKWALEEQRVIHRDASYSHPSIEQVQHTLSGGPPASPADLKALLEDRLSDIGDDLRGGNTDPWSLFWNEDQHRLTGSKSENSCRNALLTNLKLLLPDGVDAAREGSYAADTRSDIRVFYSGFNVPIEIKKDSHPDLWKAMRGQLMAKYTTDPATQGYGIYLVLWFGEPDKPVTRHPDGFRPKTPEELQRLLEQDLTRTEANKTSVVVLDVTKPC